MKRNIKVGGEPLSDFWPWDDQTVDRVNVKVGDRVLTCSLCKEPYEHWFCDDRVWARLPVWAHDMALCLGCFTAIRELGRRKLLR